VGEWAAVAGWRDVATATDPTTSIGLADDEAYRTWLRVGARGRATADWSAERREAFGHDLMAATPRDADGRYRLPFGSIYLVGTS
jgi:hypothetical protein